MSDTPLDPNSPMMLVLDRVANKWAVLSVSAVCNQPKRFNQLRREIVGISQKMLSQTLKRLERDGIVTRTVTATVPVTVEYAITDLGKTLASTVNHLRIWSEQNIDQILTAQEQYDRVARRN
jgi:DNA-binding HxlR family transcriptional regulator